LKGPNPKKPRKRKSSKEVEEMHPQTWNAKKFANKMVRCREEELNEERG